jgi:hypothetical protein
VAIFFLNPIFSALLAWPVLGERVGGIEAASIVCGGGGDGGEMGLPLNREFEPDILQTVWLSSCSRERLASFQSAQRDG